ncbi:CLUMA_CG013033, isoform A [Clunio marinus]|uniref:CLUMA_CG013033, isoform A n=1 Tax=Clunio marinus TaxID=568069 RepID=A0A1J1IHN9_9DIPT|nr:CLUMA_CG013033, isoform A [Clunio marinus]
MFFFCLLTTQLTTFFSAHLTQLSSFLVLCLLDQLTCLDICRLSSWLTWIYTEFQFEITTLSFLKKQLCSFIAYL